MPQDNDTPYHEGEFEADLDPDEFLTTMDALGFEVIIFDETGPSFPQSPSSRHCTCEDFPCCGHGE